MLLFIGLVILDVKNNIDEFIIFVICVFILLICEKYKNQNFEFIRIIIFTYD